MDFLTFIGAWLRAPAKVGAVLPSGDLLARRMAAQVDPMSQRKVIELGAGTGVVTRALLDQGIYPHNLVVIERDPGLCRLLQRRFPDVQVLQGDAAKLKTVLAAHGIEKVDAIVSSLPLLSLGPRVRHAILLQCFMLLQEHGLFAQYTYGLQSPVRTKLLKKIGLTAQSVDRVWLNLPPATIWRYQFDRVQYTQRPSYVA